ncbi:MAG: helix-turn-helix transcriptional regulator [Oscillospiraceae bacterium]|nr:helix-turn-helix transcriptional regulator [Oscillospiraceae bacterium]
MENETKLTFGEKLKQARKSAGLTQEQLAEKLMVSRQAVTKWESDRGLPDIGNIKQIVRLLDVSIDYLLDDGESLELSVLKEEINLGDGLSDRKGFFARIKKSRRKSEIVKEKYPECEIHLLSGRQMLMKSEKVIDNLLGFLTDAPFGIPDIINAVRNTNREYFLIDSGDGQVFVTVTNEFIESRRLSGRISGKKFQIGDILFTDCGVMKR